MKNISKFISCDWGTSNLRLRLVDTHSMRVIKEVKTNDGIKKIFNQYKQLSSLSQFDYFKSFLQNTLKSNGFSTESSDYIVASGMVTSSIGMMELPYAEMPINYNSPSIITKKIELENGMNLLLISGVRSTDSIMRGEEVQALGLCQYMTTDQKNGVTILPGSHSKHIFSSENQFESFKSYMTGELFDLLANQSILSNNVEYSPWSEKYKKSFLKGVALGMEGGLSANIFSIRANEIFGNIDKKANFHQLSGLLIGDELSYLSKYPLNINIASDEPLLTMYKNAITFMNLLPKTTFFYGEKLQQAIILGQLNILKHHV
ncbi:2-dehydro-3-deoxygalactonokinase [Membranihabitans marinus]|uniref:2-dehydro-3-deoxygalactonokinase n=1 Tax=Membranihabitans marinus TaxID=1227546 RepID=UPI001F2580C8|nr:2-dehydro-3-deoxygalactonokinase [Membranihabitans marinus]